MRDTTLEYSLGVRGDRLVTIRVPGRVDDSGLERLSAETADTLARLLDGEIRYQDVGWSYMELPVGATPALGAGSTQHTSTTTGPVTSLGTLPAGIA